MARIQFTSEVEEILGRLAGSVFQDSYGGYQVRGLNTPRNPQTQLQQLRRGDFRFLSAGWRNLTTIEKQTWIDAAGTIPGALRLYIGNNINLILVGIAIVSSYIPGGSPGTFPLQIDSLDPTAFIIEASDEPTIVPSGQRMLLYATTDKFPTRIFNSPAEYEPIEFFLPGEDLATPTDVITAWTSKYGVMRLNRRICIKCVLIDESNGNRGEESIVCAISQQMETLQQAFEASQTAGDFPQIIFITDSPESGITFQTITTDGLTDCTIAITNLFAGLFAENSTAGTSSAMQALSTGEINYNSSVSKYQFGAVLEFTDNADAIANGLTEGMIYRTGDFLKIVHS